MILLVIVGELGILLNFIIMILLEITLLVM